MSDVYKIGVRLAMTSNVSQMLGVMSHHFTGLNSKVLAAEKGLNRVKLAMAGALGIAAGAGILVAFDKIVDASKEYTHQIALMNAAGFTQKEIAESVASAWKTSSSVITSSAQENLVAIRELRTAFGAGEGMQHAYAVLPQVQRASAIMESITGKKQEGLGFDMVKAIEFSTKGAITVPELTKQAEMMTKALVQMNGTLTVGDFHQTLKATKSMAPYMTDDFKYTILPTLMQEFKSRGGGAQMAGTALATLTGTIKGHAIAKRNMQAWVDSGLVDPSKVVSDPNNRTMSKMTPGAIGGENLFTQNPLQWAQQYLIPARDKLKAKYGVDDMGAFYALTGNRNSAFMMQTLANKGVQFQRDADLIKNGPSSMGSYNTLLKKDPQMAKQALGNQWQNILAILGYSVLPKIIPLVVAFATKLNEFATFLQKHANVARGLMVGIGVLGVALIAAGAVALAIAAGPIALWVAGIGLASAAIAGVITWLGGWTTILSSLNWWLTAMLHPFDTWLGLIKKAVSLFGFGGAAPAVQPVGAPPQGQSVPVHTNVWLDNHKVGQAVSNHFISNSNRPQAGGTRFDPWATMPQPAGR